MMDWTSWLDYGFMRNALLAVLIITPLFGLLGTMIVNKKMAYFSDALGHSALTGIAVGIVFGMQDTTISMVIFAVIFALLLIFCITGNIQTVIKAKNILYVAVVMSLGPLVFGIAYFSLVAGLITLSLVAELLFLQFTIKNPAE